MWTRPPNTISSLRSGANPRQLLRSHHHYQLEQLCPVHSRQLLIQPRRYSLPTRSLQSKFNFDSNPETSFLERIGLRRKQYREAHQQDKLVATMAPLYGEDTPDEVKNAKGLHLITMNTPNGQAVQIYLEELKDVYGTEWTTQLIDISSNEQKKDWFLRLDPNGRIPVLVDNTVDPPFPVMETSAEMLYLLKKVDKKDEFGFADDLERSEALQWMFFWHGSGAPYQGQVTHFTRVAPEKIEYAINRFKNETLRVFGVLEIRLSGKYTGEEREYLAGKGKGKYSVADMKTWAWVKGWERGFNKEEMDFPHVLKWIDRIAARPAVQRGIGDKYALKK